MVCVSGVHTVGNGFTAENGRVDIAQTLAVFLSVLGVGDGGEEKKMNCKCCFC